MSTKNKANDRNTPKTLTPKMRHYVDRLVERFGDQHTNVKRAELKKAGKEILGMAASPAWITRNLTVRSKEKRGMYDLSVLLKLPVVDQKTQEAEPQPEAPAKKAATKKTATKKAAPKKAAKKKKDAAPEPKEQPEAEEHEQKEESDNEGGE